MPKKKQQQLGDSRGGSEFDELSSFHPLEKEEDEDDPQRINDAAVVDTSCLCYGSESDIDDVHHLSSSSGAVMGQQHLHVVTHRPQPPTPPTAQCVLNMSAASLDASHPIEKDDDVADYVVRGGDGAVPVQISGKKKVVVAADTEEDEAQRHLELTGLCAIHVGGGSSNDTEQSPTNLQQQTYQQQQRQHALDPSSSELLSYPPPRKPEEVLVSRTGYSMSRSRNSSWRLFWWMCCLFFVVMAVVLGLIIDPVVGIAPIALLMVPLFFGLRRFAHHVEFNTVDRILTISRENVFGCSCCFAPTVVIPVAEVTGIFVRGPWRSTPRRQEPAFTSNDVLLVMASGQTVELMASGVGTPDAKEHAYVHEAFWGYVFNTNGGSVQFLPPHYD